MNEQELTSTSWGRQERDVDVRTLRRYQTVLSKLGAIGEGLVFILLIAVGCASIWLVTQVNFEDVIFYDGTDSICVLDGKTGKITNVK